MGFFEQLHARARQSPKIVVLPELAAERVKTADGPLARAAACAEADGLARIIPLTTEMIRDSGRLDEFGEQYCKLRGLPADQKAMARRLLGRPLFFAVAMVRFGFAHGAVAGKYTPSHNVVAAANALIPFEPDAIASAAFFCEPPPGYPVTKLIAVADVVANEHPDPEQIASIAETTCDTFHALSGLESRAALLSYATGASGRGESVERVRAAAEACARRGGRWLVFGPCQLDAAILPDVARNKPGCPFADAPANVLIGPSLDVSNNIYKAVQWLIPGCQTTLCSQGLALPVDDISRGDDEQAITNAIAVNVVKAQVAEAAGAYPAPVDDAFLKM